MGSNPDEGGQESYAVLRRRIEELELNLEDSRNEATDLALALREEKNRVEELEARYQAIIDHPEHQTDAECVEFCLDTARAALLLQPTERRVETTASTEMQD